MKMTKEELSDFVYDIYKAYKELEDKDIFPYEKFEDKFVFFKTASGEVLDDFTKWLRYLNSEVLLTMSVVENLTHSGHENFDGVCHLLASSSKKAFEWRIEEIADDVFVLYEIAVFFDDGYLKTHQIKSKFNVGLCCRNFANDFSVCALEQYDESWERRSRHLKEILAGQDFIYVLMDNNDVTYEKGNRYAKPLVIEKGGLSELVITPSSTLEDFVYYDFEKANFSRKPFLSRFTQEEFFDLCNTLSSMTNARFEVHMKDGIASIGVNEIQTCIDRKKSYAEKLDEKTLACIKKNNAAKKANHEIFLKKNKKILPIFFVIIAAMMLYFVSRTPFVASEHYSSANYDGKYYNLIEKYRGLSKNVTITAKSAVANKKGRYVPEVMTKEAFSGSKIKSIEITGGIKYIDDYAFSNCEKLSKVQLNHGLREINDFAFKNCPLVKEIEIPPSVYKLGTGIFDGDRISKLTIGKKLYELYSENLGSGITENTQIEFTDDAKAFDPLTYCKITEKYGKKAIAEISSPFPVFVVPDGIEYLLGAESVAKDKHVKDYYEFGYMGKYSKITEFIMPDTVTSIDWRFFKDAKIKSIVIPDSVVEIKEFAFEGSELEEIEMGKNVSRIGRRAFENTKIKSIVIPDSATEIGSFAFAGTELEKIEIGKNVSRIGSGAFKDTKIKSIVIPDSVTEIEKYLFLRSDLENVKIGSGVLKIGEEAFKGTKIKNVEIPGNVNAVEYGAFSESSLEEIVFGEGIHKLGDLLFYHAPIKKITFLNSENLYADINFLMGVTTLEEVQIPEGNEKLLNVFTEYFDKKNKASLKNNPKEN